MENLNRDIIIEFLNSDSALSKFIIALLSSVITILINKVIEFYKEKKRIKLVKKNIIGFIDENILPTLQEMNIEYVRLSEKVRSGNLLWYYSIKEYPWLNSKVFDYFNKNDILKILNKIDSKQTAKLNKMLIELDYMQQYSPAKMILEFDEFLKKDFVAHKIPTDQERNHFITCPNIGTERDLCIKNFEHRIDQCKEVQDFFIELKNELTKI